VFQAFVLPGRYAP